MATVTDTATSERFEGVSGPLLDYYRGEESSSPGRYVIEEDAAVDVSFPQVFVDGERVDTSEPSLGDDLAGLQSAAQSAADAASQHTAPVVEQVSTGAGAADQGETDEHHPMPGPGAES